jgi:cation diffusion facilitator family transporter
MMQSSAADSSKLKTLKYSTIAIGSVVVIEVVLGLAVGSLAVLSDGIHALLDTLTTFVLFFATRASLKPPDEEHMYGHEKYESIGGLIGGMALIGMAILIMYEAIARIVQNSPYINVGLEFAGFIAIGYTFCIDFYRVGSFRKSFHSESSTMQAGLYHAVADLGSTVIALVGFGLATLGFYYGDSVASVVLSLTLCYLSVRLAWASVSELSDSVSKATADKVRKEIAGTKGILKYESLRVRKAGGKTFVEAAIEVPDYVGLAEAHALASTIEENVKKSLGNAEVIIHVEPPKAGASTEKRVEMLATGVEGVIEAHEIDIVSTEGKVYLTLHALVDPKMSIKRAHQIAEKIESKINSEMKGFENITVHIEPFQKESKRGSTSYESEIKRIIRKTAEEYRDAIQVRKIVTYVAGKKRYINIDCCFVKSVSVEEAHRIGSQIEESIQDHFRETIVTVHMEETE